jgi:hypothetical protein
MLSVSIASAIDLKRYKPGLRTWWVGLVFGGVGDGGDGVEFEAGTGF